MRITLLGSIGGVCCALLASCLWSSSLRAQGLDDEPEEDLSQIDQAGETASEEGGLRTLVLRQVAGAPELDGNLDEPFWDNAQPVSIDYEFYPSRLAPAVVETRGLVALTDTHLYIGFVASDPDPDAIRSITRTRDAVKEDDYVSIVIDATGNLRRKFEFRVNPHGSRADILQDSNSNRYWYDWDTDWEAEAEINHTGYTAELAIPLDSIRQPRYPVGERPTWFVILKRSYPRMVDRTLGAVYEFQRESTVQAGDRNRRLVMEPYYIYNPDEERDEGDAFQQVLQHGDHEVGADLALNVDSGTTLFATINPNYTDVEADIARESINNPFTPFQPEKRSFFQQGRDLFSSYMPVVYTRNIIQPEYGLGLAFTGRRVSSGAFAINDTETNVIMPDNLGSDTVELSSPVRSVAARYIQGDKQASLGFMGTARNGTGYENLVAGVDGLYNFGIDDKVRFQAMYSSTEYPVEFADDLCESPGCLDQLPEDNCLLGECALDAEVLRADPTRRLEGHGLRAEYQHDGPSSLYWLRYFDYAADFRADLGYEPRTDFRQLNAAYGRNWFVEARRRDRGLSRIRAYAVLNHVESASGELIEDGFDLWGEFRGTLQTVLRAGWRLKNRAVNRIDQNDLALGDNAPRFDESYLQWYYETSPTNSFVFSLDGRYGNIADPANLVLGRMHEYKPAIEFLSEKLNLGLEQTYRNFLYQGSTLWREDFTTLKLIYHPWEKHVFRVLLLDDGTWRDTDRFLAEVLPREDERTTELTYLYRRTKGFSVLLGAKLIRQEDPQGDRFTSDRQVYLKLQYKFDKELAF